MYYEGRSRAYAIGFAIGIAIFIGIVVWVGTSIANTYDEDAIEHAHYVYYGDNGTRRAISNDTIIIDQETGVMYVWFPHMGVTPLYNADGTLMIAEIPNEQ